MGRSSTIPLVAGVVFCATVAVLALWIVASLEFSQWDIRYGEASLPTGSVLFRSVYKMSFCLPLGVASVGAFIVRAGHRPLSFITWYISGSIVLTVLWMIFGVLSMYFMYAKANFHL